MFCVHRHKDQQTANPLDLEQWDFYILSTETLNEKVGDQKTITFSSLLKIGAIPCEYIDLHNKIVALLNKERENYKIQSYTKLIKL